MKLFPIKMRLTFNTSMRVTVTVCVCVGGWCYRLRYFQCNNISQTVINPWIAKAKHSKVHENTQIIKRHTSTWTYQVRWSRAWHHSEPWLHGPVWILPKPQTPQHLLALSPSPPAAQIPSPHPEVIENKKGRWGIAQNCIFFFIWFIGSFRFSL